MAESDSHIAIRHRRSPREQLPRSRESCETEQEHRKQDPFEPSVREQRTGRTGLDRLRIHRNPNRNRRIRARHMASSRGWHRRNQRPARPVGRRTRTGLACEARCPCGALAHNASRPSSAKLTSSRDLNLSARSCLDGPNSTYRTLYGSDQNSARSTDSVWRRLTPSNRRPITQPPRWMRVASATRNRADTPNRRPGVGLRSERRRQWRARLLGSARQARDASHAPTDA